LLELEVTETPITYSMLTAIGTSRRIKRCKHKKKQKQW